MRNLVLSPSQLDIINRCPREYFFKYNLNRTTIETQKYLTEGEYIHYILEQYYRQRKDRAFDLDKLVETSRVKAVEMIGLTMEETEGLIALVKEYLDFYFNETWEIEEVEKPFTKLLWEDKRVDLAIYIKGKFDLLIRTQGFAAIVDHKKVAQRKTPSPRGNQPLSYCWASERNDFIFNQLGTQKSLEPIDKFQRHFFHISPQQIEEWREQTIYAAFEIVRFFEKKFWPARIASCWNPISGKRCIFHQVCEWPDTRWDELLSDNGNYQTRPEHDLMGAGVVEEVTE